MLPKLYRLTQKQDFKRIYQKTAKFRGPFLSIRSLANNKKNSRFGFIVANNITAKATKRNFYRRQLRTIIWQNLVRIKPGYDVILKFEKAPLSIQKADLAKEALILLQKNQLIK
jgi:ribonuclease P protein component